MIISCSSNKEEYIKFIMQEKLRGGDLFWLLNTFNQSIDEHNYVQVTVENIEPYYIKNYDGYLKDVTLEIDSVTKNIAATLEVVVEGNVNNIVISSITKENVEENKKSRPGEFYKYYIWGEDRKCNISYMMKCKRV